MYLVYSGSAIAQRFAQHRAELPPNWAMPTQFSAIFSQAQRNEYILAGKAPASSGCSIVDIRLQIVPVGKVGIGGQVDEARKSTAGGHAL